MMDWSNDIFVKKSCILPKTGYTVYIRFYLRVCYNMATTSIVKWGNSRGVRLPKHLLDSVNLSENDTVEITAENDSIVITKAISRKHKTLKERLAGFSGDYSFEELNTGSTVGREVFWKEDDTDEL
jgi:antitoxin MazE